MYGCFHSFSAELVNLCSINVDCVSHCLPSTISYQEPTSHCLVVTNLLAL